MLAPSQVLPNQEASPLSMFDQALTLGGGSPASSCAADGLTPGITPELTARKPRRASRFGGALQPSSAAINGPPVPGVTSPGIAAFLQEQALRDAARRDAYAAGGGAGADASRHGLPKAQPAAAMAGAAFRYAAWQPTSPPAASGFAAVETAGRQPLQEPAMCLTPPRSQRPPSVGTEPEAADVRLNRARAAVPPFGQPSKSSISLDRASSFSRSSSGSAFSRASSLNDAKV